MVCAPVLIKAGGVHQAAYARTRLVCDVLCLHPCATGPSGLAPQLWDQNPYYCRPHSLPSLSSMETTAQL